ncbi:MAG: hypothetical protein F6K35_38240, partial [Okeania sp. SIO2H7]|nr:hypothetical protein [Okeania sp. SIO2H7]
MNRAEFCSKNNSKTTADGDRRASGDPSCLAEKGLEQNSHCCHPIQH